LLFAIILNPLPSLFFFRFFPPQIPTVRPPLFPSNLSALRDQVPLGAPFFFDRISKPELSSQNTLYHLFLCLWFLGAPHPTEFPFSSPCNTYLDVPGPHCPFETLPPLFLHLPAWAWKVSLLPLLQSDPFFLAVASLTHFVARMFFFKMVLSAVQISYL